MNVGKMETERARQRSGERQRQREGETERQGRRGEWVGSGPWEVGTVTVWLGRPAERSGREVRAERMH